MILTNTNISIYFGKINQITLQLQYIVGTQGNLLICAIFLFFIFHNRYFLPVIRI